MKDIVSIIKQISETIENADISKMWNGLEGKLGCSLFCFVMFQEFEDERFKTVGIHLLDKEVVEYNSMRGVYETFWSGFSGLFWLINFLLRSKSIKNDYDINLFDSTLLQFANRVMKKKNDYLNGSIGIFFSLISSTNKVSYYATQFVNLLSDNKIKKGNNKFCWVQDALHSNQYNLSLSHGMSSIVIMLSKIHQKGIEQEKCAELIEGAVNYILAQKLPQGNYNSIFGNYALESMEKPHSSRLAWCYGDLGIAVALWRAAQALGRKDWESEAKSILLHASQRRDLKDNYVMDACFCHGTSGIAHVFNRMWRETGMDECKHAAAYWIEQTLDMAKFAKAGFQLVAHGTVGGISTESRGGNFWHGFASSATASLISGAVGLTCAHYEVSEGWTRLAMVAAGGLSGGVSASMAGGDFWDGVCNGLICVGLNHALHYVVKPIGPEDPPKGAKVHSGKNLLAKCYWHYQFGGGKDYWVDASTLDLDYISFDNLNDNPDGTYWVNLFDYSKTAQSALALGKYAQPSVYFGGPFEIHFSKTVYIKP